LPAKDIWLAALLHVGLPAGLLTLCALWRFSRAPLWLTTLFAAVPAAFWTAVAALLGCLLPIEAIEPFLWFVAE
jgi:hypothetical protein